MKIEGNIEWFKKEIEPVMRNNGYELEYKFFKEGDLGALNQIEFNSKKLGGNIDFWGLGWLGIFMWDYENDEEIVNLLIEPNQEEEKAKVFKKLIEIIDNTSIRW